MNLKSITPSEIFNTHSFEYAKASLEGIINNDNCSVDFDYHMRKIDQIHTQLLYSAYFDFTDYEKSSLKKLVKKARYTLLDSMAVRCLVGFDTDHQRNAALSTLNYMYGTDYHNDIPGYSFTEKFKNLQERRKERSRI